ncbi:ABC transporter permease [Dinghuibacter silviterrae]|uniref:Putative ABC transport system permease protein n=1 Tax=Dinghuibacter silviterrae TaxID=1539049 RepID=A0A4R8DI99_9BACT|nr:ABC transporter permease [Dinghuibacter silviterrae]TDW97208.1 putative ABC transport system permease protein [Dinghuibacter silviterrae]
MFRNYLTTALRNLRKNRMFTLVNVAGLAIGTLCCLYIVLYVEDQYSYDRHNIRAEDIYRIDSHFGIGGQAFSSVTTSPPIAPQLKKDFPEVEQYTRVVPTSMFGIKEHLVRYKEKAFYESDVDFVDSTFFDVFTYHFDRGTAGASLLEPYTVVLLKPTADKIFGDEDPLGKVITIDNAYGKHDFKVTGVVDESLGKSHIHANMFLAMNSNGIGAYAYSVNQWAGENFTHAYIRLAPGAHPARLETALPAFLDRYGADQLKKVGMHKKLMLQPLLSIHTTTGYIGEMTRPTGKTFLRILMLIALLIQVIACINFMNLSTARASKRAKEVGVRKVLGAGRKELVRQFLGESLLLVLIGTGIAIPLLYIALPQLNQLTGADIPLHLAGNASVWALFIAIVLSTGFLAGSYPAFYLSAFRVIKVMKGNFTSHISAGGIRRSLVVFQFTLSILLVTGIVVIRSQLHYVMQKDLGFSQDKRIVFFFRNDNAVAHMPAFVEDLRQLSSVKAVGRSTFYPSQDVSNDWPFYRPGQNPLSALDPKFYITDEHFVQAAGITLVSGRDFREGDSSRVIINETMARRLGLDPAKAPGTRLIPLNNPPVEIAGVMKDFNYASLYEDVKPFMLWCGPHGINGWSAYPSDVLVNTNTDDYSAFMEQALAIWKKDLPGEPIQYRFMSDDIQLQYEADITLANIINTFALIAVFISCLGLFGLAAFSAEQRTKEIGIRKVLGASVGGIVQLLSGDFVKPVLLGFAIATPVAWWAMHRWLQSYAYRVPLSWWMFVLGGVLALTIALLTVSLQALRAARVNPVKSLRSE